MRLFLCPRVPRAGPLYQLEGEKRAAGGEERGGGNREEEGERSVVAFWQLEGGREREGRGGR